MSEEDSIPDRNPGPRDPDTQVWAEANRERSFELVMKAIRELPPRSRKSWRTSM